MISVNHTLVYYNHQDELGTYYSINTPKTDAGKREIPIVEGVREAFEMERNENDIRFCRNLFFSVKRKNARTS